MANIIEMSIDEALAWIKAAIEKEKYETAKEILDDIIKSHIKYRIQQQQKDSQS